MPRTTDIVPVKMAMEEPPRAAMEELPREPNRYRPTRERLEQLLSRVGPNTSQFYRDARRLIDGEVVLETGSHMVGHCAREIESALREVLVLMLIPEEDLRVLRKDGEESKATHRLEVGAIIKKLGLPDEEDAVRLWREMANRDERLAARTHRTRHEAAPPIEKIRAFWDRYEELLEVLASEIERRFAGLLEPVRALADIAVPTKANLKRLGELPNAYVLRREFFDKAGPGWLAPLDGDGYFNRPEGFADDPDTGERVIANWPQSSYLRRVAPAQPERFVAVTLRITPAHEFMANDFVQGGRTIPPEIAAPLAEHIATFIAAQTAPLFLIAADCAEWARDLVSAGQANAGRALLGALLTLAPARENGTGNE